MSELTLGLDVGANSLGWVLLDESKGEIHGIGVRIFPEGVDRDTKGGEVSKNAQRRLARAMRRQIARRSRRKRNLRRALVEAGLLPSLALKANADPERVKWESDQFKTADPYTLRKRSVSGERLSLEQIGLVILHLNQHRGFLSNRKTDRDKKKENSEILQEISDLGEKLAGKTLGEYLADQRGPDPKKFHLTRVRGLHTHRGMYEREFAEVFRQQRSHYPDILTNELKEKLHRLIFFQRPLRPPSPSLIGRCELEPRLPRCHRADRRAQKFRLFQEVNNLRVIDMAARRDRELTDAERDKLLNYLRSGKERTFEQVRKHLFVRHENILFNLERGGRTKLQGMPTDAALASKKMLGKSWEQVADDLKDRVVAAILDDDEPRLRKCLTAAGFDSEIAESLLDNIEFEAGYSSYSLHAIKRLLPYIATRQPLTSRDARTPCALRSAGYLMPWEHAAERKPFLPLPPNLTNPLVRQALHEVRKVLNCILRELVYRPGHTLKFIRLELAREVRGTGKQRAQRSHEMRDREKLRDAAKKHIAELGFKPTLNAVNRYLLWKEQEEICVYSGRAISPGQLFGGEVDTDHILPYSRSLDDSLMNQVVCFRAENDKKGNQTPFEWLAKTVPAQFEAVLQRAKRLPYPKLKRFYQETIELDDFFARQFVDTTYITTQVFDYVRCLGAEVICPKGQHTADLRHLWGLDTILQELEDSPAWRDAQELRPGEKNRLDHRHHAVDALVIALTTQSRLQQLAKLRRNSPDETISFDRFQLWAGFRKQVLDAVRGINVSHRVRRKVSGALHEETIYGATPIKGEVVVRKSLTSLTCSMIPDICDPIVRGRVISRLKEFEIDPGRGKDKIPAEVWKETLWMDDGKSLDARIAIRKVRYVKRESSVVPIRGGSAFVKPGSLHHACLFEFQDGSGKTRRDAVYVTMLEALRRIRAREPIIQRVHPESDQASFVMSVCPGDALLAEFLGEERLVLVSTLVSTQKRIHIVDAKDARPSADRKDQGKTPNSLRARKVTVDPLGRIRWAND